MRFQYLTAGNFNALVEFLPIVSGLEQGMFIPSVVFMNGFRFGEGNWEIAFGPSVGIRKMADGYYDGENDWHLERDWYNQEPPSEEALPETERRRPVAGIARSATAQI